MLAKAVMCDGVKRCWRWVGVEGRGRELCEQNRVCAAPRTARQGHCSGRAVAASHCLACCLPWLHIVCWVAIGTLAYPWLPLVSSCLLQRSCAHSVSPLSCCMHIHK